MSTTEIALIKQQMDNFIKSLEDIKSENSKAHDEIKLMIEKAMASKANAWVEDAMRWGIYLVAGIIISSIVYLVIKQ